MNIIVKGAREHNLKNISIELPRGKFIVFTGLSGSGKSSLAIDTIYAEGQRRYVESLSAYARQFLGELNKPDVDHIEGLSPAICIDQKTTSRNPRSTVGTVTEIYDYLRLLYARVGIPHCPNCGREITNQTSDEIIEQIQQLPSGTRFHILAPVIKGRKGEHRELFERLRKDGFARVIVDGMTYGLDEEIKIERDVRHEISVLVDRLQLKVGIRRRLADSVETALRVGEGFLNINIIDKVDESGKAGSSNTSHATQVSSSVMSFSTMFSCPVCEISLGELAPRNFSFNSPYGACPECVGLGSKFKTDEDLIINKDLTLSDGAVIPFHDTRVDFYPKMIEAVAEHFDIPMSVKWEKLTAKQKKVILSGTGGQSVHIRYKSIMGDFRSYDIDFDGVLENIDRRYREADSDAMRDKLGRFMREQTCNLCGGTRLKKESLSVTVGEQNIHELCQLSVNKIIEFIKRLELGEKERFVARRVLKEITDRLKFLEDVGLGYLTLGRSSATLAGGEAQRIRLATQIGSGLAGVLYVLDEPSIGLHQKDNERLINTLKHLQALGNTLIVVEHDEDTMRAADHIVDIGPGAGKHGGRIDFEGTFKELLLSDTLTGQYVSGRKHIPIDLPRRSGNGDSIMVKGAHENNLRNIDVRFPLGTFICVTGVSGSGKSTLVIDTLWKAIANQFFKTKENVGAHRSIEGLTLIDKVVEIDQSPIGRTPRSNPVTYIGVFDEIRKVFAMTPEASVRGYKPGRFSFNVKGGRCEACHGDGTLKIEMHFLPDVYVECDVCKGSRYNQETLEVHYKGKNISEILAMSIEEALEFFENIPRIKRKLQTISDVGLGYVQIGQPAPTLSGGEAQRVKLASELSKVATGKTLYILDEPTTGLHFEDVRRLLEVLHRLVSTGNTVIVIEHNLEIIKTADHIIDLGPNGGDGGGEIIASGTPEEVAANKRSYTGKYLKPYLDASNKKSSEANVVKRDGQKVKGPK